MLYKGWQEVSLGATNQEKLQVRRTFSFMSEHRIWDYGAHLVLSEIRVFASSPHPKVPLVFHGRKVSMCLRITFPFSEVLSLGYDFLFLLWTSCMPVWVTVWCLSFHTSRLQVKSPYCSPACMVDCNSGQLMNIVPFKLAAKTGGDMTFWDFPLFKINDWKRQLTGFI